jgi:hypothetical protein
MRCAAAFGVVLAVVLSQAAYAQSFVGEWTATAHLPGDTKVSETVKVTKTGDGYAITGKPADPAPGSLEAGPGTDIVIDGDKFSYTRSVLPDGAVKISYKGVVSGDTFIGTAEVAGTEIPYTGVRTAAGK